MLALTKKMQEPTHKIIRTKFSIKNKNKRRFLNFSIKNNHLKVSSRINSVTTPVINKFHNYQKVQNQNLNL